MTRFYPFVHMILVSFVKPFLGRRLVICRWLGRQLVGGGGTDTAADRLFGAVAGQPLLFLHYLHEGSILHFLTHQLQAVGAQGHEVQELRVKVQTPFQDLRTEVKKKKEGCQQPNIGKISLLVQHFYNARLAMCYNNNSIENQSNNLEATTIAGTIFPCYICIMTCRISKRTWLPTGPASAWYSWSGCV